MWVATRLQTSDYIYIFSILVSTRHGIHVHVLINSVAVTHECKLCVWYFNLRVLLEANGTKDTFLLSF